MKQTIIGMLILTLFVSSGLKLIDNSQDKAPWTERIVSKEFWLAPVVPKAEAHHIEPATSSHEGHEHTDDRNCRITQKETEHIKNFGGNIYAIDIKCNGRGFSTDVYFPTTKWEFVIEAIGVNDTLGNYIVIRHGDRKWVYGHTVTTRKVGDYINTRDPNNRVLGQDNISGVSTGYHAHIEQWKCEDGGTFSNNGCVNVSSTGQVNPKSIYILTKRDWNTGTCSSNKEGMMVNYAYQLGGLDFVGTIAQESMFEEDAVGDEGHSFGYCQIHDVYNQEKQDHYRTLGTKWERISYCYELYQNWVDRGVITTRLYGYNVRDKGIEKLEVSCS